MKKVFAGGIFFTVLVATYAWSTWTAPQYRPGWGGANDAKNVYAVNCASCHGQDLKGDPDMAKKFNVDLAALNLMDSETSAKSDWNLDYSITRGTGKMPVFGGKICQSDIANLVGFIRWSVIESPGENRGK